MVVNGGTASGLQRVSESVGGTGLLMLASATGCVAVYDMSRRGEGRETPAIRGETEGDPVTAVVSFVDAATGDGGLRPTPNAGDNATEILG